MAAITRMDVRLVTGNRSGAGTDGSVFIAVCGREFSVDSSGDFDDFEQGDDRTYIFGAGANVANPERNDPRSPFQLDTNNVNRFPRWVRLDGGSEWDLERVTITLNPGQASQVVLDALGGANHLFLGPGRFLFL
jgi:hypothetical protein